MGRVLGGIHQPGNLRSVAEQGCLSHARHTDGGARLPGDHRALAPEPVAVYHPAFRLGGLLHLYDVGGEIPVFLGLQRVCLRRRQHGSGTRSRQRLPNCRVARSGDRAGNPGLQPCGYACMADQQSPQIRSRRCQTRNRLNNSCSKRLWNGWPGKGTRQRSNN